MYIIFRDELKWTTLKTIFRTTDFFVIYLTKKFVMSPRGWCISVHVREYLWVCFFFLSFKHKADKVTWDLQLNTWEHLQSETISCIFHCGKCIWYSRIRLGDMKGILYVVGVLISHSILITNLWDLQNLLRMKLCHSYMWIWGRLLISIYLIFHKEIKASIWL